MQLDAAGAAVAVAKSHARLAQLTLSVGDCKLRELDQLVDTSDLAVQVNGQFDNDARGFTACRRRCLRCAGLKLFEPLTGVGGSAGGAARLGGEVDQRFGSFTGRLRNGAGQRLERAESGYIFERDDGDFKLDRFAA